MEMLELWDMCGFGLEENRTWSRSVRLGEAGPSLLAWLCLALAWPESWRVWHWSLVERAGSPRIAGSSPLITNRRVRTLCFLLQIPCSLIALVGLCGHTNAKCGPLGNSQATLRLV